MNPETKKKDGMPFLCRIGFHFFVNSPLLGREEKFCARCGTIRERWLP